MKLTNIKMEISNNIVLSGIPNNLHFDITRTLTLKIRLTPMQSNSTGLHMIWNLIFIFMNTVLKDH